MKDLRPPSVQSCQRQENRRMSEKKFLFSRAGIQRIFQKTAQCDFKAGNRSHIVAAPSYKHKCGKSKESQPCQQSQTNGNLTEMFDERDKIPVVGNHLAEEWEMLNIDQSHKNQRQNKCQLYPSENFNLKEEADISQDGAYEYAPTERQQPTRVLQRLPQTVPVLLFPPMLLLSFSGNRPERTIQ